jgi:hypothetical protein
MSDLDSAEAMSDLWSVRQLFVSAWIHAHIVKLRDERCRILLQIELGPQPRLF